MNRTIIFRVVFYILGLLILALGLTLNTKAGLGVSAIISVAYSISLIFELNFGNVTLGLYTVFVLGEMVLHLLTVGKRRKHSDAALAHASRKSLKFILLTDFLQIPLSLVFTRFLNVFSDLLPQFYTEGDHSVAQMAVRVCVLLIAILLTGVGAAMSLNMRIIPNPGDGIVQAISDYIHKSVGFTKNCFDLVNITIALFNHFAQEKMSVLAGVEW